VIIDFQHHYTPRALHNSSVAQNLAINKAGKVPKYFSPEALFDLDEHIRVMDFAGIDAAILSCGLGMDGAPLDLCRQVNNEIQKAAIDYPGRFFGIGHVPPLSGVEGLSEVARCRQELGFKGVVIPSEIEGLALDDVRIDPFWAECERQNLYVFIHPALRPAAPDHLQAFDLVRSIGREFSLITTTIRLIDGGVLDRFPKLKIQMAHLGGGIAIMWERLKAFHDRKWLGTQDDPVHGRLPERALDHYLRERLFFDTAGVFGSMTAVEATVKEIPPSQVVFGTDYPLEIHTDIAMKAFVDNLKAMGVTGHMILSGSAKVLLSDN
jgi:predicted TIM-barrel fold metal-dependent hydrolase